MDRARRVLVIAAVAMANQYLGSCHETVMDKSSVYQANAVTRISCEQETGDCWAGMLRLQNEVSIHWGHGDVGIAASSLATPTGDCWAVVLRSRRIGYK